MQGITFNKVKDRKMFLRDLVVLRISLSMMDVSIQTKSDLDGIKILHANKQRKERKQASFYMDKLIEFMKDIQMRVELRDIHAMIGLCDKAFPKLVKILELEKKEVSLSHIAFYMVKGRLSRENIYPDFKFLLKAWGLKRVINVFEKNGITSNGSELELANKINLIIKDI